MNQIKNILILVSVTIMFFTLPIFVHAQNLGTPTGPGTDTTHPLVTCGADNQNPCTTQDAFLLIQNIINLVFMFAGFVVAFMFMYAGFLLLTSQGNPAQISKAKNIFKRVVMGFVIMFLAYITVKNLLTYIGAKEFIDIIKT